MSTEVYSAVDDYLGPRLAQHDAALDAALAASQEAGLPEIAVSPNQGKLLEVLARSVAAKRVLEIGTLGGYSTIWLARALADDGRVTTLEADPRHAEVARANLANAGVADRVDVRVGRAIETLPQLEQEGAGPFDLIFIDADKPSIPDYFAWSMRLTRPGSLIVVDNVVRRGKLADSESTDPAVQGCQQLVELLTTESRVAATVVQTVGAKGHDGFALATVLEVSDLFGLLNVNKPAGVTSRDAVNRVQWLLKQIAKRDGVKAAKVGHAGTLDPIATGVLVLCVGQATKLIEHVQRQPKRYRGTFLLGRRSPSDDVELEAEPLPDAPVPSVEAIEAALPSFVGDVEQVPPAYSAIKIDGKKAYDLARAGDAPEMKPRPVTIHSLEVVRYEFPELVLDIRCGSGTYIRSLGRDLAESLGTAAVMSELERTEIGLFRVEDGVDPKQLDEGSLVEAIQPAGLAVADLPRHRVSTEEVEELRNGRFLPRRKCPAGDEVAAFGPGEELIALLKPRGRDKLQPTRVFV